MNTAMHLATSMAIHRSTMRNLRRYHHNFNSYKRSRSSSSNDKVADLTYKVLTEMSNPNSELKTFFELLKTKYTESLEEEKKGLEETLSTLKEQLAISFKETDALKELLERLSFKLNVDEDKGYTISFNGIEIPSILSHKEKNTYQIEKWDIASLEEKKVNLEETLTEQTKNVEELKRKLRFKIFKREELKEQIKYHESKINTTTYYLEKATKECETYSKFGNLSEEELELLKEFLHQIEEKANISREIRKTSNQINRIKRILIEKIDIEKLKTVLSKITENKSISLEKIVLLIRKIELQEEKSKTEDKISSIPTELGEIVDSFLLEIYYNMIKTQEEKQNVLS